MDEVIEKVWKENLPGKFLVICFSLSAFAMWATIMAYAISVFIDMTDEAMHNAILAGGFVATFSFMSLTLMFWMKYLIRKKTGL